MILDYIQQYSSATKVNIDHLILDILPDILDKQQKENKLSNLLYSMHKKDKTIENKGTSRKARWILSSSKL
jgi:ATP-dependent DNA helicase RecG